MIVMERDHEEGLTGHPTQHYDDGEDGCSLLTSRFFLGHVGEVLLSNTGNGVSWNLVESLPNFVSDKEQQVKFTDVYAVDLLHGSLVNKPSALSHSGVSLLHQLSEMHWFRLHVVQKTKTGSSLWGASVYTFGNMSLDICKSWVDLIKAKMDMEARRPKNLLVFVHPRSGKGHGCRIWETVAPLFQQAAVKTQVIVTERAGHARDMLASMPNSDLCLYDGCIAVGGDGFFSEILNGVLLSRHKGAYPPFPGESMHSFATNNDSPPNVESIVSEPCDYSGAGSPILTSPEEVPEFHFPNDNFRFGIIPAGSTDAIVMCTVGVRDPVTSAFHIILGKRVHLDIAQLVRWKKTSASNKETCIRYAASFAGYGFYGDVITESEKHRWMGPKRYDLAGTKVFLKHRSYEAEVAYLEVESEKYATAPAPAPAPLSSRKSLLRPRTRVGAAANCRVNCEVCNSESNEIRIGSSQHSGNLEGMKWSTSKGCFISIGAAIISCRNDKAPDGLVADAHLSDGFLHLVLIRDCPRPLYLMHLIEIARRGGHPLDFEFVEHHKTPVFMFKSSGKDGVWNVDGESFPAHLLSAQVFRGLITLFGTGLDL